MMATQALQYNNITVSKNDFLRYSCYSYSFEKAKTGAFRPHESFFDEGQTKENEDEDNFF